MDKSTDLSQLAESLVKGLATEEQYGAAARLLQTGLAANMVSGLSTVTDKLQRLQRLANNVYDEMETRLSPESLASMELDTLNDIFKNIHAASINILDLERKIAQGRNLIETPVLSSEEQMVVKLFSSFSSQKEKKAFLEIAKEYMSKSEESDEFEKEDK